MKRACLHRNNQNPKCSTKNDNFNYLIALYCMNREKNRNMCILSKFWAKLDMSVRREQSKMTSFPN